MSERDERQQQAARLDEQIAGMEQSLESGQEALTAMKMAREALIEPPRKVTACRLRKHFAVVSKSSYAVDCSECHKESFGLEDDWTHCPKCGSVITEVYRENDPTARMQDKAAKELLDKLQKEIVNV
jgi:hypothetical protein